MKLWYIIPVIVVAVLAVIFFGKGCQKPKEDDNEKQLQALQQKFDSLSVAINGYKDSLLKYDIAIAELKSRDSVLSDRLERNKIMQKQLKTEYVKTNRFTNYQSNDISKYFADSLYN